MSKQPFVIVVALLGVSLVAAAEPAVDEAVLAAVKKLTVRVTVTQAIGKFSSFHGPAVGDTLEIDLGALPEERLLATQPRGRVIPYVSLTGPFQFVQVRTSKPPANSSANPPRTLVQLASEEHGVRCRLSIVADGLQAGDKVRLGLATNDGFLGSLLEAEGAWNDVGQRSRP